MKSKQYVKEYFGLSNNEIDEVYTKYKEEYGYAKNRAFIDTIPPSEYALDTLSKRLEKECKKDA